MFAYHKLILSKVAFDKEIFDKEFRKAMQSLKDVSAKKELLNWRKELFNS